MQWRNRNDRFGAAIVLAHWSSAALVITLYALGLWMVELTYYSPWYREAPAIHKQLGILLLAITCLRLLWRLGDRLPSPLPSHSRLERLAATIGHRAIYLLLLLTMASGYLLSTADGRPIGLPLGLALPPLPWGVEEQEVIAGRIHAISAHLLIAITSLHAAAAVKHRLIDGDQTLGRMLIPLRHRSGQP
jgi:cytochrome b561